MTQRSPPTTFASIHFIRLLSFWPTCSIGCLRSNRRDALKATIASLGAQRADWGEGFDRPFKTYSFAPVLTKGQPVAADYQSLDRLIQEIVTANQPLMAAARA